VTRLDAAEALEQGRLQRQPAYIRRMGLRSLALLLGASLLQRLLGSLVPVVLPAGRCHRAGRVLPSADRNVLTLAPLRTMEKAEPYLNN
jgi:hypothetical protein